MRLRWQFAVIIALLGCHPIFSQATAQPRGFLSINGRVRINNKPQPLKLKRFYLFAGGLAENKALIDRIKAADPVSRDCYYCSLKVSSQFMDWLNGGDGPCESPYCREITDEDAAKVPEFKAAVQKGAVQFKKKPVIAKRWLVTSLDKALSSGFFDTQKKLLDSIMTGYRPVQTTVTDNSNGAAALFSNIPLDSDTEGKKFTYSNVLPIEVGQKSYVWICEVDITAKKTLKTPFLEIPDASKTVKNCDIVVRDVKTCTAGTCAQK